MQSQMPKVGDRFRFDAGDVWPITAIQNGCAEIGSAVCTHLILPLEEMKLWRVEEPHVWEAAPLPLWRCEHGEARERKLLRLRVGSGGAWHSAGGGDGVEALRYVTKFSLGRKWK